MVLSSKQLFLSRAKTLSLLNELEATTPATASTLYIPAGLPHNEMEHLLSKLSEQQPIPPELIDIAASSVTGAALFWSLERKCLVLPPFPITERTFIQGFLVEPLRSLLSRDFKVALILVRLGRYAIGVSHGENLVSSKVGTGLVHGRHKQGGSSQQRFRRHREKQIEYFLTRVGTHAREQLETQARTLDYVIYGGAWTTILLLKKRCPFLQQFNDRTLPPLLDIPEPRQTVLEAAIKRAWSSKVIEWRDEDTQAEKGNI